MPKRKAKRKRRDPATNYSPSAEDRRAEVITVAWMLTLLATVGAEVVGTIARAVILLADNVPDTWLAFSGVMLFVASVTGLLCLGLTPLVCRFRREPPPRAITVFAVAASVLPLVIGIMLSLR